jgi:hypothetical protein
MTKAAKKTSTKKAVKRAAAKANGTGKPTKTAQVIALMQRARGTTREEALALTKWKGISFQVVAKNAGLKLKMEKAEGKPIVYRF